MRNINHLARQQRHQKIGLNWKIRITKKKKSFFLTKVLLTALLVSLLDFSSAHFYHNIDWDSYFIPKKADTWKVFILEEDWFVLKREVQTEKRDKQKQHDIIEYIVKKWDSLNSISYEYQIKVSTILDANPWLNPWQTLVEWKKLTILPIDWIAVTLNEESNIRDFANKYRVKQEIIREQNAIWSWISVLKKWQTLLIPWIRNRQVITKRWKALYDSSNYFYDWKISWNMIVPCKWTVTQHFHKWHYWIDIANKNKWPIFAAANWVVSFVWDWWNWWYWNMVVIDHWKWMKTLYAHNESFYVEVWDTVKQWQTIAWMWKTWRVRWRTWIHLHFEVIVNWKKRNPYAYF